MDYKAIGARIQHLRKLKRLTQSELSEKVGISLSFMGHVECGTRIMSIETLAKLARVLDCSTDYILGVVSVEKSAYEQTLEHIREWIEEELEFMEADSAGT